MNEILTGIVSEPKEPKPVCIVRVCTSYWADKRGIYQKKSLTYLKKRSHGFEFIQEDVSMIGADEVVGNITNLDQVDDGIYCLVTCNESRDWETGHVDGYDYQLIPAPPVTGKQS